MKRGTLITIVLIVSARCILAQMLDSAKRPLREGSVYPGHYITIEDSLKYDEMVARIKALEQTMPDSAFALSNVALDFVRAKVIGGDHADLISAIINVASLCAQNGNYERGAMLWDEGLAMIRRLYPDLEHPFVATIMMQLALAKIQLGEYAGATPLLEESLAMQRHLNNGADDSLLAAAIDMTGLIHSHNGDTAGALLLFEEALSMRRRIYGGGDQPAIVTSLNNLGNLNAALGDSVRAETLLLEALEMNRRLYPDGASTELANSLGNLGATYSRYGDSIKAIPLLEAALNMLRTMHCADNGRMLATIASITGEFYLNHGNCGRAAELLEEARAIWRRIYWGTDGRELADCTGSLGILYSRCGDYAKSGALMDEAVTMHRRLCADLDGRQRDGRNDRTHGDSSDDRHWNMAQTTIRLPATIYMSIRSVPCMKSLTLSLRNAGSFYLEQGACAQAAPLLDECLSIDRALCENKDCSELAISLRFAATAHRDCGDYNKASSLYAEALAMDERLYCADDNPEIVQTLSQIGEMHCSIDDCESVYVLFGKALAMALHLFKGDHEIVSNCMGNLGYYYLSRGEESKAAEMFTASVDMQRRLDGKAGSRVLVTKLNNLGLYYLDRGNYSTAHSLLEEAVKIERGIVQGRDHTDLANILNSLGALYMMEGDYTKSLSYYQDALAMRRRLLRGADHSDIASSLNNTAILYQVLGDTARAADTLASALAMQLRISGDRGSVNMGRTMRSLGEIRCRQYRYPEAGMLLGESYAMIRRLLPGSVSYDLMVSCSKLAHYHEVVGDMNEADSHYREVVCNVQYMTGASALFEIERQQVAFIQQQAGYISEALSFFTRQNRTTDLFDVALWWKSAVLSAVEWRNRFIAEARSHDHSIAESVARYLKSGRVLADTEVPVDSAMNREWQARRDQAARQFELEEDYLTRRSGSFAAQRQVVTWTDVRRHLAAGDAAVEFLRLPYHHSDGWSDSVLYLALVVRPEYSEPQLFPLCEERDLIDILRHPVDASAIDQVSYIHDADRCASLYRYVWGPLDSAVNGVRRVYISPDGLLNLIQFALLKPADGSPLYQRFAIEYLFSSRDLVLAGMDGESRSNRHATAVIYGNVDFGADSIMLANVNDGRNIDSVAWRRIAGGERPTLDRAILQDRIVGTPLNPLTETKVEIDSVGTVLAAHAFDVIKRQGADATEESFLSERSPAVLHIATHGYQFAPPASRELRLPEEAQLGGVRMVQYADNPLLRSGILLAGADHAWTLHLPWQGIADGIVTAYDVAHMDLAGTELVVLSACETGLGDIVAGEGVFGLKRAFRAAGSKAVMMSLWKVPDAQTRELMVLFYINWLDRHMSKTEALAEAQREMAKRYDDPYYWGAFVLVGE